MMGQQKNNIDESSNKDQITRRLQQLQNQHSLEHNHVGSSASNPQYQTLTADNISYSINV